jgi:hypothetical protein
MASMNLREPVFVVTFATLAAGSGACIGPAGGPQSAPGANVAASATTAPTAGADGKAMIWNGEGVGASAKSWTSCGKKDAPCKTTLAAMPSVGHDGSTGLRFHGEGSDWLGGGWNWFGWWPTNGGSDLSTFKNLTFWFKLEAKSPAEAPDPGSVSLALGCSNGKKTSADALLATYDAKAFDGQWHEIVIPLAEFLKAKGADFDLKSTWELRVSTWSGEEKNFNLYFDDIGFNNR